MSSFPVPVRTVARSAPAPCGEGRARRRGGEAPPARTARPYAQTGKLDFVDNTVNTATDTITLRGVVPNPPLSGQAANGAPLRELVDGEFVTVVLEDAAPVQALTVPRAAVLSDQRGDYVYVVDGEDKLAQQRRITLGQSTPTPAVVGAGPRRRARA